MNKGETIQELSALLEQERAYAYSLKKQLDDFQELQPQLVGAMDRWKGNFEALFHKHHQLEGKEHSSECRICLSEHQFPLSELVPPSMLG